MSQIPEDFDVYQESLDLPDNGIGNLDRLGLGSSVEKTRLKTSVELYENLIKKGLVSRSKDKKTFRLTAKAGAKGFTAKDFMKEADVSSFYVKKGNNLFVKVDKNNCVGKNRVKIHKGEIITLDSPPLHEIRHTRKSLREANVFFTVNGRVAIVKNGVRRMQRQRVSVDRNFNRMKAEIKQMVFLVAKKMEEIGAHLVFTSGYRNTPGKHGRGEAADFLIGNSRLTWHDADKIRETASYLERIRDEMRAQGINFIIRYEDKKGSDDFWKIINVNSETPRTATGAHLHVAITKEEKNRDISQNLLIADAKARGQKVDTFQLVQTRAIDQFASESEKGKKDIPVKRPLASLREKDRDFLDRRRDQEQNSLLTQQKEKADIGIVTGFPSKEVKPLVQVSKTKTDKTVGWSANDAERIVQLASWVKEPTLAYNRIPETVKEKIFVKGAEKDKKVSIMAKVFTVDDPNSIRDTVDAIYPDRELRKVSQRRELLSEMFQGNESKLNELLRNEKYGGTAKQNRDLNNYIRQRIAEKDFDLVNKNEIRLA